MVRYIDSKKMGRSMLGWLDSRFHFSFAEYRNPENVQFGQLRVVNDDLVQPGTGFDTHPHRDMEILSYVIDGELTHADSMDNKQTLKRGEVQYMSAGTGVTHSEHNFGEETLRFLQIWIFPDKKDYKPNYGDQRFVWEDRVDRWMPIAASVDNLVSEAPIKVHQDVNVYAAEISEGGELQLKVAPGRQAYLILIEGEAQIGDIGLNMRDALEVTEEDITVKAKNGKAHLLCIEMKKG